MSKIFSFEVWLVLALIWTAVVGYLGFTSMPQVPLDMSPSDPETQAAIGAALRTHAIAYGLTAAVPPLILLGLIRLLRGSSKTGA